MKRRRILIITIVGLVLLIGLLAYLASDNEPSYQGHSLSYWISICRDNDSSRPNVVAEILQAEKAIRAIGPNALPHLLKWLDTEPTRIRLTAHDMAVKILPWNTYRSDLVQKALEGSANARANSAITGFRILGPIATPAIPRLLQLSRRPRQSFTSSRAIMSLGEVGQPALPTLQAIIEDPQHPNREIAIQTVGYMSGCGVDITPAIPALQKCLQDPTHSVVVAAEATLAELPSSKLRQHDTGRTPTTELSH
ncbi:MAG TPA: HEAT repeat domain-containing protein [Clostridia bacterium]|nr:HEAT repeat domain-containing protein [Clostridia bacterium]